MNTLLAPLGQLLSLLLVLYLMVLGLAYITQQQRYIGPLNDWILRMIGRMLRACARSLCSALEAFFRWLGSLF
jgi:hypothetical protein